MSAPIPQRAVPLARLVIAGGGTGGHVYPGVAVAEEVLRRNPEAQVVFVGTQRGMESRILPALGYDLRTITVSRLKGGGLWGRIAGLFRLPIGIFQSWRVLRRVKPQVVLGVGGYASGPALIAAWLTWRKTAVQEQNATPGMTNRWLGKITKAVFLGFEAAGRYFSAKKTTLTGNPIRAALAGRLVDAGHDGADTDPEAPLRVLVFGGSQGARFLNEHVPALIAAASAAHPGRAFTVVHQTGSADEGITRDRYTQLGVASVTVLPYIDDMPAAYGAADIALCRAGALTVAELTAVGLPALLVPFPFAADNHQEANAQALVAAGAARLVRQDAWDAEVLSAWLGELSGDRAALATMASAARGLGRLDAAPHIVDRLEGIAA